VRHYLVVAVDQLHEVRRRRWLVDRVSQAEGAGCAAVPLRLSWLGAWELEDFTR